MPSPDAPQTLTDRTYVVTGSASGLGEATAAHLRDRGATVLGVDRHDADVVADLSTADGRAALVDDVTRLSGGRVNGVIACAGLVMDVVGNVTVNHFGAAATVAGLRPLLARAESAGAVIVSSGAIIVPYDDELLEACLADDEARAVQLAAGLSKEITYATSKRAIARWVRRAAPTPEWAGARIPLNCVAPAVMRTPMSRHDWEDPERMAAMRELVPMPLVDGFMDPEQLAPLLAFLTGPENRVTTGQVIFTDAGFEVTARGDDVFGSEAANASPVHPDA